ncbi:MAG TPA: MFS transporter [Opitutaceae bacterium]|nr:MFS transporter [Opitutaceae bacterium]
MKKRHGVLGLLAALSVITYLDRVCISVAGPRMQDQLHLSPEQWGWILSVFILSYGIFEIPSGALGDRIGQRSVLTRIVIWWSVFTSLTGLAWNFGVLLVSRFLFGAGEAGAFPNMAGSVRRWFPAAERARAQGVIWGASRIGGAVSPWLVVPLIGWIGWRPTFVIFGGLGLAWAVVWFSFYHDHPRAKPGITAQELAEIGESDQSATTHAAVPWSRLFRQPRLWLIMTMYWSYVWGSMFYLTWFPTYLVKGRGLAETEMGKYAALPFILGALGNFVGGALCDRLSAKFGLSLGRRMMGAGCLAISAFFLVAVALTTGKVSGVILLALGFGVMDCMLPAAWAMSLDVGGRYAGAVSGAMNSAGQAGGFVCTLLFGYLVQSFGRYDVPILVIAGVVLVSAFLFWKIDAASPLLLEESAPPST